MAAEIRDPFDEDSIEAYFQEKLASARQLVKNKCPRVDNKLGIPVSSFYNVPLGQQYFQQPVHSGFAPIGATAYRSSILNQVPISIGTETKEAHGVNLGLLKEVPSLMS
ncbi:26738_t:CDS:1 [Gigaspora margarita]|uniref:26738_t:CDS:1 n=1 Tax=Gigaspora margarita TaxID=4874 RepID=A0ABN7VUE4_GIGMA|nr:26738_t:CDS:1 [Gigaspora margarita]